MTETTLPGAEAFSFDGGGDGVLLIHGFSGSPASLRRFGEWFAAQGLSVLGVRLPGHGTSLEDFASRPWQEWSAEVERAFEDVRGRCRRVLVLAQSFGAAVAARLAAERPSEVDALALLSPYLFDWRQVILPVARHVKRWAKPVGDDIAKPGETELAYPKIPVAAIVQMAELQRLARRDLPRVVAPTLVFEPGRDHAIPRSNARRVFEALGSERKELVPCPRSYHVLSLDHDAPMVRDRALELLRSV